jgi:two-component system, NarL family, sensor histidine kinase BarA
MSNNFFKSFFGNWSLERKCLLLLGLALLASLLLGFFAVQRVASRLVMETTRQTARDYANAVIGWSHIDAFEQTSPEVLELLRPYMLQKRFEHQILRLKDNLEHESLPAEEALGSDFGRVKRLYDRLAASDAAAVSEAASKENQLPESDASTIPSNAPGSSSGPITMALSLPQSSVFEEDIPSDGFYYYYHPVPFQSTCLKCHAKLASSINTATTKSLDPFRVIRVQMPYRDTQMLNMWSYSLLLSIAICTLAMALFFIHWVLKRLVILPLSHLRQVSEEITRGDTKLRFSVDTEDEFNELAESFNRMLRHLTETQDQLQTVNDELDLRVDELARVNLQLFEANRLKGEFLANMSHELRTPLNSILGFSEVLQGFESLTDKQRRYAFNIQNSGRLLLDMINDILDLAKVEAGKMEIKPTNFCILSVIHAQCEILQKMADDKNIDLRIDSSQSEMRIEQDQGKVQQILTNLLSNAIKFTPEGGLVTVTCDWLSSDEFVLSVADTGVGVAPNDHEIIFEKFRQAKGVTGKDGLTREFSGTGLGLSIVRELCRLLGGDISLKSELGCGSTFRVILPRSVQKEDSKLTSSAIG